MIPLRNKYMMMERELDKGFELRNLSDCLIKIVRTTVSVVVFLSGADTGTFTLQLLNASVD